MKRGCVLALLALLGTAPAAAAPPQTAGSSATVPDSFADPALEARARALQRQLRCLVCQGESLDESNAPLAADLRRLVRARIAAGESDRQIKDYLVARYGDFILMKPPFQGDTYALWLAPFLVLLLGGGVTFWVVRAARLRGKPEESQ